MYPFLMKLAAAMVPAIPLGIGIIAAVASTYYLKWKDQQQPRHSPLTRNLLRTPGYSLRQKINVLYDEILLTMLIIMLTPLLMFITHLSQSYFAGEPESVFRIVVAISIPVGVIIYFTRKLLRLLTDAKYKSLGLDGELATAEELNQLMLDGCRVFHDIPIKYGNIDHVVVSHSGVFSVNSKLLGKPKNGEGGSEIFVDHDRGVIRFPDREYRIPVQQFETEANWLSKHLTNSVGQSITVEPILALPGWYVKERIGRGSVFVINPYKPKRFFVHTRQVLSPAIVQQVAHQLEQICRDLEPVNREKQKRWEDEN